MSDKQRMPDSVAARWDEYVNTLQSGRSRFMPLPWPEMEQIVRLGYRRKIGIVAQRHTREATAGRRIASFIAAEVGHVLLCTGYPPTAHERLHILDTEALTPDMVNARVQRLINDGTAPVLIVIERYERMRLAEKEDGLSRGDELMWCGRRVSGQYDDRDIPSVFTTVVDQAPVMDKWVRAWAGMDSPANVMTDFCRTVLLAHRVSGGRVRVRVELDSDEYQYPLVKDVAWPYK